MLRDDCKPRVHYDAPVELLFTDVPQDVPQCVEGVGVNISTTGMYVHCEQPPDPGTALRLKFPLFDERAVEVDAWVMRSNEKHSLFEPEGVALQFGWLEATSNDTLEQFVASRLEPAVGAKVHMKLETLASPISATVQDTWDDVLAVEAHLPFLTIGSSMQVQSRPGGPARRGNVRWVSVNVCPQTGVPRLNIGIGVEGDSAIDATASDATATVAPATVEEATDPVHTVEFVDHSQSLDRSVRTRRKRVAAAN